MCPGIWYMPSHPRSQPGTVPVRPPDPRPQSTEHQYWPLQNTVCQSLKGGAGCIPGHPGKLPCALAPGSSSVTPAPPLIEHENKTQETAAPQTLWWSSQLLQAAYLDTLGGSHVRWHLAERTLGALLKAKPELWEVLVAAALDTGEQFFLVGLFSNTLYARG